ncbi:hypothetical protein FDE92_14445 [Clostridium botulinum]|nr:hypothetical protein [Clostridium botulinum]NFA53956.1 hypothetical protein [Clostridium botulinum]NFF84972.1 hypothetical protein [Clostridium botulinum]NFH14096.1 hypothetical protein [Clostridium botulinum]NFH50810.1 hypothetical protein [Clostridium botulinum]NFH88295.1 hypothetical protein [Clostridium botulinum]
MKFFFLNQVYLQVFILIMYSDGLADIERCELFGTFIASIPAGATITLKNKSATEYILVGTGIDNQAINRSAIILQKIA